MTIRPPTARIWTFLLAASACTDGSSGPADDRLVEITFTASVLRAEDLTYIAPLGGLNPPGHTIPNDHIGFYFVDRCPCDLSPRPVFAPAAGTIRVIQRGQDDGIEVGEPPEVPRSHEQPWYYLGHVLLRPELGVGSRLRAGQEIGTTSALAFAVDLGLVHPRAQNQFIVPERYNAKARYGVSPLRYYAEPLRTELYARVRREGSDKDGKFDYDIAGRLVGAWFHESVPKDVFSTSPQSWTRQLAFVYSEWNPAQAHVVSGGTVVAVGIYYIDPTDADFRQVSMASGLVRYRLWTSPPSPTRSSDLILLVQLLSDDRLRIESFPGTTDPAGFTPNAMIYLR